MSNTTDGLKEHKTKFNKVSNIMEDITEHDIYMILLNMLLNKEQCKSNRNK